MVILVYVPGPKNTESADKITKCFNNAFERSVDQPVFILGEFNTCDIYAHLPALQQYITCPTRSTCILDKCFGNISDAYKAVSSPALGKSDHNVIHLLPKYRQKIKREKPALRNIQQWSEESMEELNFCFETTDWQVFFDSSKDAHEPIDVITSCIQYCEDTIMPVKTVRVYPNNKLWLTKELKECLNEKKFAFIQGDTMGVKDKEKELRTKVRIASMNFKNRLEQKCYLGNVNQTWVRLHVMMRREGAQQASSAFLIPFQQ